MVRVALFAFASVTLFSFTPATERAIAQASRPQGFKLPMITGTYPGSTFQFRDEEAKRLVNEVLPIVIDDTTRASVREDIVLPDGTYGGLTIDIALNVKAVNSICEERHVNLVFAYQSRDIHLRKTPLGIKDGRISDHAFASLFWRNRYFKLPAKPVSHDAASASCRAFSADTSNWQQASNWAEYITETRRLSDLIKALETLPMSQIYCLDPQGKPCGHERSKLLSLVQTAPPERSESLGIPSDGVVTVYRHYGYKDADQVDYVATLRSVEPDLQSLNIRFSKSLPLPPI